MPDLHSKATAYILSLPFPQREICQSLRDLILTTFPEMTEAFKWNFPAYYCDGKRICLMSGFRHHVTLELFYGAHLHDAKGIITGAGKNTRHVKFRTLDDVDAMYLIDLLTQSIALSRTTL